MATYLGDFVEDATVVFPFTLNDSDGARTSFSATIEQDDIVIFKDGTELTLTAGTITISAEPGSRTGLHLVSVDMSNDTDFTTGADYCAVLYPSDETVASQLVAAPLALWSCENRVVDVGRVGGQTASATGAVDFDHLATIEGKTSQMAFTTGHIHADVGQICSSSIPASNFCADYDGTGYAKTNSTIGIATTAGSVSGNVTGTVGGIAGTIQTLDALDTALDTAHGAGSWATATGFVRVAYESVLDDIDGNTQTIPADVVTALGTGSTLSALATAAELAKVLDYSAYGLTVLVGALSNAQDAAEVYTYTVDGVAYTGHLCWT
jgi:hypothetical protein